MTVRIDYEAGSAVMPEILQVTTISGFTVTLEEIEVTRGEHGRIMNAAMCPHGRCLAVDLIEALFGFDGVDGVERLEGDRFD